MEAKILKIMNILKRFSLEDLSTYMECDTSELIPYIDKFVREEVVHKISNDEYLYEKTKSAKIKRKLNTKHVKVETNFTLSENQLFDLEKFRDFPAEQVFTKKRDLDYYNNCDEKMKKLLIKHIVLFNLAGDMSFSEAAIFLGRISKEFPEYKMNAQWYRIKYKRYIAEGLPGLYQCKLCTIDNKVYEQFKKLYLSPKQYTQEQAYELLMMKGYESDSIPTLATFMHRVRHEYSKEAIKKFRTPITQASSSKTTRKRKPKPHNILFEDAANKYWRMIKENDISLEAANNKKRDIEKLKDYFKGYKLGDIIQEEIIKFKKHLTSKGFCHVTVRSLVGLLLIILRMCGFHRGYDVYANINQKATIYSLEEVKNLIQEKGPAAWVIALGLKLNELQAFQYEDINFEKETIIIKRRYMHGKIFLLNFKQIKELKVPGYLLKGIDKEKTGFILGQKEMPNYESCIYAHIMLLQSQNVPMNLIAKGMGYKSMHSFYEQFHHVFPQKLDEDFDILKPLGFI